MVVVRRQAESQPVRYFGSRRTRAVFIALGVVLAGYLVSLIARGGPTNPAADGWFVVGFEALGTVLCFARAVTRRHQRALPLLLGASLLMWTAGDAVLTVESIGGAVSSPSAADALYLSFYPLMYAALVVLLRREVRSVLPGMWLDGAVAGLGVSAVSATFLVGALEHALGGAPASVAVNLAYPVGDLLLLALAVGGSAVLSRSGTLVWRLLAFASAINAAGDTFNLFGSTQATAVGTIFDGIAWPLSILCMSLAVWVRSGARDLVRPARPPGFLLPGVGAAAGLAVVFTGAMRSVGWVALALGMATLFMAGLRFALSLRGMTSLTEERRRQSVTDELTGLGNRRMLGQIVDGFFNEQEDPDAPRRRMAFLFVDLNRFKEINDSFGHAAGDALLRQLGPRLHRALRAGDVLVRLGGDELGVVLMDTDSRDAHSVADRVLESLTKAFAVDGVEVHISASIGVACAPVDANDLEGLLRCADVAMYRAKLSRCGVAAYEPELDDEGNRLRLADELRVALEERSFTLHFQPQVDLRSGEIVAVEALLRWPHPRLGEVPPLQFLPLAEELGLMPAVTSLVLDLAFAQCAAWHAEGTRLAVSVNVSASNLLQPAFVDSVRDALRCHALAPSACVLEITETTIIEDFQQCRRVIEELRALGVAVSIDDFGAGFTSLAYLGSLAVNEVKLDRSFVTGLTAEERERDRDLVRATIDLGHTLGLRVVAEGIEDPDTLELLTALGCDIAQGYYMGEPTTAADLRRVLGDRTKLAS